MNNMRVVSKNYDDSNVADIDVGGDKNHDCEGDDDEEDMVMKIHEDNDVDYN